MRKRTVVIIGLMLFLFAASLLFLRLYKVDLIQTVVVNAMVQKAPASQEERIRRAFAQERQRSSAAGEEEKYLSRLMQISQRLERTQSIDDQQLEELLALLQGQ